MKIKGVAALIGLAAVLAPGANAGTMHGVVVGKQHGRLLVAAPNGVVQLVAGSATIGSRLVGSHVVGHATRARIHGIVVKRIGTTMILSSNKHLLAVHTRRVLSANAPTTPAPGAVVNTTVAVNGGELDEESEDTVGQVNGPVTVQATITAVGAGTVTLSVNGQTFTVNLPAGLTLPASLVNQTVTLTVDVKGGDDDQGDDDQGDDDHGGGGGDD